MIHKTFSDNVVWKSIHDDIKNLTVCHTGKCGTKQVKVVEGVVSYEVYINKVLKRKTDSREEIAKYLSEL